MHKDTETGWEVLPALTLVVSHLSWHIPGAGGTSAGVGSTGELHFPPGDTTALISGGRSSYSLVFFHLFTCLFDNLLIVGGVFNHSQQGGWLEFMSGKGMITAQE